MGGREGGRRGEEVHHSQTHGEMILSVIIIIIIKIWFYDNNLNSEQRFQA